MPRAERRADLLNPFRRHSDGIAAAFLSTLRFQKPGSLFLRTVESAGTHGLPFEIKAGIGLCSAG
jgi:hypothetical protein